MVSQYLTIRSFERTTSPRAFNSAKYVCRTQQLVSRRGGNKSRALEGLSSIIRRPRLAKPLVIASGFFLLRILDRVTRANVSTTRLRRPQVFNKSTGGGCSFCFLLRNGEIKISGLQPEASRCRALAFKISNGTASWKTGLRNSVIESPETRIRYRARGMRERKLLMLPCNVESRSRC